MTTGHGIWWEPHFRHSLDMWVKEMNVSFPDLEHWIEEKKDESGG